MILQLTENTTSIGIRLKAIPTQEYLADWPGLVFGILPGERNCECCAQGGSPWYVWGCWPGHRTGVDLMNPPKPDFPAFFINASEVKDSLVIFNLPERWHKTVPYGRYSGFIRYTPKTVLGKLPINAMVDLSMAPVPQDPGCYHYDPEPCHVKMPCLKPCILSEFDIDYGPRCSQHIIDRIDVELGDE